MRWLVILLLVLAAPAWAQDAEPGTSLENRALTAVERERYVKARDLAEALLQRDPNSVIGHYVLGVCYYEAEGSLPRAKFHFAAALHQIEQRGRPPFPEGERRRMHLNVLERLLYTAHEMELYEEELALLDRLDEDYGMRYPWQKYWVFMKQGKLEEARSGLLRDLDNLRAMRGELSDLEYSRAYLGGLNTLGAVLSEMGDEQASYEVFKRMVSESKANGWPQEAVYLSNAGECALNLGDLKAAEQYFLEATRFGSRWTYSNPWAWLADIYLAQGRLPESVSAARQVRPWERGRIAVLNETSWAQNMEALARVLMVTGHEDRALILLRQVQQRRDRNASQSTDEFLLQAARQLTFWECLKTRSERLGEQASWSSALDWAKLWPTRWEVDAQMRQASTQIAALLSRGESLDVFLRPHHVDSVAPTWLIPSLGPALGPGVIAVEAARVMLDPSPEAARLKGFMLATRGECRVDQHAWQDALDDLNEAAQTLPSGELLLRARVEALQAAASEGVGDFPGAMSHWQRVMGMDPGVVRRLGLSLPVEIQGHGEAVSLLAGSPRFRQVSGGFRLIVEPQSARLTGPDGSVLCRVSVKAEKTPDDTARALCKAIHQAVFAPRVDLSQIDIGSLDGSNESGATSRDQVRNLIIE
ncbi:MAG: tetratricopeptide repeat protein [Armatimonadetes bacterium]|nr:tetratricopeptide repeat protein [Armatimonadota bacterium]